MRIISTRLHLAIGSLAGAAIIHAVLSACGTEAGNQDKAAHAEPTDGGLSSTDGAPITGTCACAVSGPIAINGTVHTIGADTDPQQLVRVTVDASSGNGTRIVDGPFVITDIIAISGAVYIQVSNKPDCSAAQDIATVSAGGESTNGQLVFAAERVMGAHIPLAQGETLCVPGTGRITVAGFRPYH
jgi:hypothetical protein